MIGKILGNRYEITEKIAQGGMSVVYKALDLNLNRYDAVKVLKKEFHPIRIFWISSSRKPMR